MEKDLTQLEILRLPETFNLTDGHAHRPFNADERKIVDSMGPLFHAVEREKQRELEKDYITAFYDLTRQTVDYTKTDYMLLPSASASLELVANYLRLSHLDIALIEPCFDGLANVFKRHNVALEPIPDEWLDKPAQEFGEALCSLHSKALCFVSPNNPTGSVYSEGQFKELVAFCRKNNRVLILDTTFRPYKDDAHIFDEYALLQESGIDYIVIEDTGKTWPTKELKVSILAVSRGIHKMIYDIYTDFIYHHSPFTITLVTAFIKNSKADGLASVKDVVNTNRQALREAVAGSILTPCEKPFASVSWLKINAEVTAAEVAGALAHHGVFVLPGNHFFWSDSETSTGAPAGEKYVRVSLVRDPASFARAAAIIKEVLAGF
jgi:aspartate/methionine/tyrosine aminotransferase